jgi:hypothetical protein
MSLVSLSLLRTTARVVANLFSSEPVFSQVKFLIPLIWNFANVRDPAVTKEILRVIMYATCGDDCAIEYTMANINIAKIVQYLDTPEYQKLSIQILGNICCGPLSIVDEVMNIDCLLKIKAILENESKATQLACYLLSNLSLNHKKYIQTFIELSIFLNISNIIITELYVSLL